MDLFRYLRAAALAVVAVMTPATARAQSPADRILVIVNAASPASVRIGEYYRERRGIASDQLLRLTDLPADPPEGIDRAVFDRAINGPIARWLARHQAQDRILFIVLTKGIPVRINGGASNDAASVDSELSVLYQRMTGKPAGGPGPQPNPYFLGDRPLAEARRFTREDQQLYLVTRLDGYTVEDVLGLIDRASQPSRDGRFVLDGKFSLKPVGNNWLERTATRLKDAGISDDRIVFDQTATVLTDQVDVLGYYSWGSNDPAIKRRHFNLTFLPGAIGGMFVSTDARTFREPPAGWTLPTWQNRDAWFAGSPQSLSGDLIREGITGVAGHVAEPLLGNTIRPDVLFPAYVMGFSLAEAYYLAMPSVSWMTVVVGDPLCAPFADSFALPDAPPIDPATELPTLFAERRLAASNAPETPVEALKLALRAESRLARDDKAGARADLEEATKIAPALLAAQVQLASWDEADGDHDRAIARYRAILERAPNTVLALNNLAYSLAVHKGELGEARPLAEKAHQLAPQSGVVLDTLGWIRFMSGEAKDAVALLTKAALQSPNVAEVHLHLAMAHSSLGNVTVARAALDMALKLDPGLASRKDVEELQKKLPKLTGTRPARKAVR